MPALPWILGALIGGTAVGAATSTVDKVTRAALVGGVVYLIWKKAK